MTNILICDDDNYFAKKIENRIYECISNTKCYIFNSIMETHNNSFNKYDVAFLDIELSDGNGFDLAQDLIRVNPSIFVIFISNYEDKVFDAFKYRPLRFIRKSRLEAEIDEVIRLVSNLVNHKELTYQFTDTEKVIRTCRLDEICYFESTRHYINVVTKNNIYRQREKLANLEHKFASHFFVRVQLSYVVNMKYIKRINGYKLELNNGMVISIGRSYLKNVRDIYMKYVRTFNE